MGVKKYMSGLIDKARKKVDDTVSNLPPMKQIAEGLDGGARKPRITPAKKRKKIKPKK